MNENMPTLPDEVLVKQAKSGRIEAYAELAARAQEKIYHAIFGMTRNHEDASDLTQETFMQAFKALKSFKQRSSFTTWIYRIAVNLTLNFLKKKSREKGREDFMENAPVFDKAAYRTFSHEIAPLKNELKKKIEEAIERLPLAYRAAFNLVVFQGMSHGRVAEILGCSENTVSWRMHKARKMLQADLRPYIEGKNHEM